MSNSSNFFSSTDLAKAGAPIWERLFLTSLNYKDTINEEDLRRFGLPTVGDFSIDQDMYNQVVHRYLTIDAMVEHYKKGTQLSIVNHNETKDIYEIVSTYLLCWKQTLENGINIGGAPLEDLVNLDRFATSVYDHAVEHITDSFIDSSIFQFIGNRKIGRAAFTKKEEEIIKPGEVKRRESLASLFSERVFSVRSSWK